jgi:hypothetical protein
MALIIGFRAVGGVFMSFRGKLAVFGLTTVLAVSSATALAGLPVAKTMPLEQVVAQESVQQQAQLVDEQKYAEIKKMFAEADSVGKGLVDKIPPDKALYEFNNVYDNICTVYSLKDVKMYKFNKQILKEPKSFINTMTNEPMNLFVIYKAVKPGAAVPPEIVAAAQKEGLTSPVYDENTPGLKENEEIIVFVKNLPILPAKKGTKRGLLGCLPATADNLQLLEKVFSDYHASR